MIIYNELKRQGRTQRWLAEELKKRGHDVSYSSMCNFARMKTTPKLSMIKDICDILNIDFTSTVKEYGK